MYLFPLPMIDEDDDGTEDLMALSRQLLFDKGAARPLCPSTCRPDVQIEPPKEIALHQADGLRVAHIRSKFLCVGTQKIEGRSDVMNVTKAIDAAGQVTDKGQCLCLHHDRNSFSTKSANKFDRLLEGKRGFIELNMQKGVFVIPKESNQGGQMDKREHEIEKERQAKVKSSPVLRSEKEREEHATFRSWCEGCVAGRATEDSHKRSASESLVLSVAMDYGFHGRDTDTDPATILVLVQRLHRAVGACQVLRKGPEPYAFDCVLAYFDTWSSGEVLLKADNESAIQALVDAVRSKRDGRTMVEKSAKYSHQSDGAAENGVRRTESLTTTYLYVLQEKLGYTVDSKGIVLPWLVRHAAHVLSRFVKRDDGHSAWARLGGKECESPLAQIGETVDFKIVRIEMAELEPRWATGTFWDLQTRVTRSSWEKGAAIELAPTFRRRTKDKQWQRHAFTTFMGVPWNPRIGGGSSDGEQEKEIHHRGTHPTTR